MSRGLGKLQERILTTLKFESIKMSVHPYPGCMTASDLAWILKVDVRQIDMALAGLIKRGKVEVLNKGRKRGRCFSAVW